MSSTATATTFPESSSVVQQRQESSSSSKRSRRYRNIQGRGITLCETRHADDSDGAIEYVLREESDRRGCTAELALLGLSLILWLATSSAVLAAVIGLFAVARWTCAGYLHAERTSEHCLFPFPLHLCLPPMFIGARLQSMHSAHITGSLFTL